MGHWKVGTSLGRYCIYAIIMHSLLLDITPWRGCKKRANALKCVIAELMMAHDILSQIIEKMDE